MWKFTFFPYVSLIVRSSRVVELGIGADGLQCGGTYGGTRPKLAELGA
jgi:hypothetical protein